MSRSITITVAFALALAVWPAAGWAAADGATPAKDGPPAVDPSQVVTSKTQVGQELACGNHKVVVRAVDITPVVRNGYSERFKFDTYDNPKLRQLRDQEKLEDVVAEGKDEFDRQVILMDYVYRRIKKFGTPTAKPQGALEIFKAVDQGHTFYCAHYATSLASCAASLGWIDRTIGLHVGNSPSGRGAPEHSTTEMWSNQYRKWVLFDPTYAMYVERDGVPQSGWEVRQAWFYGDADKLDFVIGKDRKKYKKADMPIFRATHAGFGDLALGPRTIDKLAFMFIIPNTNLMDAGPDYAKGFILKDDKVCQGVQWHTRDNPKEPATEPYFPLGQADLTLTPQPRGRATLKVEVDTMTPNFADYRYRLDGGPWQRGKPEAWTLHGGENTLEILPLNLFGIEGVPSKVVLDLQ